MVEDGFNHRIRQEKFGELIHDLSIQYAIKNYQCPKILQEEVYVMREVKFKSENNNDKLTHKKRIKMEVVNEINLMRRVLHKHINMKSAISVVQ